MARDFTATRRELDLDLAGIVPDLRRQVFVAMAQEEIAEFDAGWRAALGREPDTVTAVDGMIGKPISEVMAGGVISHRVQPTGPIVQRALELFDLFTKVVTGGFKSEHALFVDGAQRPIRGPEPPAGSSVEIVNLSAFARKAETRGFGAKDSAGFPDGLMEGIAAQLRREFRGAPVAIRAKWDLFGGQRLPAVAIG